MYAEFSGSLSVSGLVLAIGLCLTIFGLYACAIGASDYREGHKALAEARKLQRQARADRRRASELYLRSVPGFGYEGGSSEVPPSSGEASEQLGE